MKIDKTLFKKPFATLAIIAAVGVTAGITSVATAQVGTANANAPLTQVGSMMGGSHRGQGIGGTVSSVNGTTIVVLGRDGTSYTVDASSAAFRKGPSTSGNTPSTITIADIKVGDTVSVRGTVTGTSVVATDVMDGIPSMGQGRGAGMMGNGGMGHGVHGTVSAINGTTITLTNADGTSYTVDASTAGITKVSTVPLSDIHVGDTLGVEGTISGTKVVAGHIMAGVFPKDK